jgi:hypothetical protein
MGYDSKGGDDYYDKVTITIDRRCAEDLYYALLLAFGGQDYGDGGKNGKNGNGYSYGYEPPPRGYSGSNY